MSDVHVDRAYITIDGKEYNFEDIKVGAAKGKKSIGSMNRRGRAKGFASGCMEYPISGTTAMIADADFDPLKMLEDDDEFSVTIEYRGGKVHNYLDVQFVKVDIDSKDGDYTKYGVEMLALDRVDG